MVIPIRAGPDLSHWGLVDTFTVEQAACLWVGVNPSTPSYSRSKLENSQLTPILQLLSATIQAGNLPADSSRNVLTMTGDYSKSFVTRDDLIVLATAKGQRPTFLFDTLMPDLGGEELPKSVSDLSAKSKGGRPREYDWDALTIEIIRIANSPDGLPETQAELIEHLLQWCENTWGKQPADSSVKSRISKIFNELGLGQKLTGNSEV